MKGLFLTTLGQRLRKSVSALLVAVFTLSYTLTPATTYAQSVLNLPTPGTMVGVSAPYSMAMLKGVKVDLSNPFMFDFIVDKGDTSLEGAELKGEGQKLIKYFLTALTVPEKDIWVNLSPYEKDRIVAEKFGQTEMGRDLLAQDYILKQLSATLVYPESDLGKEFWARVYAKAKEKFGTADISMNTFNKVWIMPDKAVIFEKGTNAYIVENRLKVLTEQDYLALSNNKETTADVSDDTVKKYNEVSAQVVRDILLPEITREVNTGKNFAPLRQIYNSLLLAAWYKVKVQNSILNAGFADKNKIAGDELADKAQKQQIYDQYIAAFKKGVYSYIKEDTDAATNEMIPRKYFSGGAVSNFEAAMAYQSGAVTFVNTVPASGIGGSRLVGFGVRADATHRKAKVDNAESVMTSREIVYGLITGNGFEWVQKNFLKLSPAEQEEVFKTAKTMASLREGDLGRMAQGMVAVLVLERIKQGNHNAFFVTPEERAVIVSALVTARKFLEKSEKRTNFIDVQVVNLPGITFGIKAHGNMIYIERGLLDLVKHLGDKGHSRLVREFIRSLSDNDVSGKLAAWKYAKTEFLATDKTKTEKDFYASLGISEGQNPENIIQNMVNAFDYSNNSARWLKLVRILEAQNIKLDFDTGFDNVNVQGLLSEVRTFANWIAAETADALLNGTMQPDVNVMFALAGSPTTAAHFIGFLGGIAMLKARSGRFDLTQNDPNKIVLEQTLPDRTDMNKNLLRPFQQAEVSKPEYFGNGEDRLDQLLWALGEAAKWYSYMFGTDHFFVFMRDKKGNIKTNTVNNINAQEIHRYASKPGFKALLTALKKSLPSSDPVVAHIDKLLAVTDFSGLLDPKSDLRKLTFPLLDVLGKAWLINHALMRQGLPGRMDLLALPRGNIAPEELIREAVLNGDIEVDGEVFEPGKYALRVKFLPMPQRTEMVSSSDARKRALVPALLGKTVERFYLASLPLEDWFYIFTHPKYCASLFDKELSPVAATLLTADLGQERKSGDGTRSNREIQIEKLKQDVREKMKSYGFTVADVEYDIGSEQATLKIVSGSTEFLYVHSITNLMTPRGWENQMVVFPVTEEGNIKQIRNANMGKVAGEIIALLEKLNGVKSTESAMINNPTDGGIDFDMNNIDLDIKSDGQGIKFNMDPAMLQAGNFDGLVPVILNVTPVTDLPMFLGAKEPEHELAGAGV
ncbi:MAG: hypothetical protein HQL19_05765 [Candidatus Omnitrophica bacterium]|nr:hypothetical protein [Candidatus Omnitrophota bacterium]